MPIGTMGFHTPNPIGRTMDFAALCRAANLTADDAASMVREAAGKCPDGWIREQFITGFLMARTSLSANECRQVIRYC